jgi:hypothetical protein
MDGVECYEDLVAIDAGALPNYVRVDPEDPHNEHPDVHGLEREREGLRAFVRGEQHVQSQVEGN